MKRNFLIVFLLIIILPAGTVFSHRYHQSYKDSQKNNLKFKERKASWFTLRQILINEITKFNGEAGIVIKDLEMNWELNFNKNKLFPSASLAKIPVMAACFLAAEEGRLQLDHQVALKYTDKLTGSGVLKNMSVGSTFNVESLIGLMIYDSDNTATNIVTNLVGINYLNSAFKSFGLKNTDLSRKIADYQLRDSGIENYTTAEDMALLLEKIYRGALGNKRVSDRCISMLKLARLNDRIPKYLPVEITIAHKTGLERNVCHDVGIVFTRKGDFIIAILTKDVNSSNTLSKEFIANVSLHVYNYFAQF